jgi:hypothetical protein
MHVHHPGLVSMSAGALAMAGRRRPRARPPAIAADAAVVWLGGAATDEDSQAVRDALAGSGPRPYRAVVREVGERVFRRDLARLGGLADVGFLQSFYQAHARSVLRRLDGSQVRIESGVMR